MAGITEADGAGGWSPTFPASEPAGNGVARAGSEPTEPAASTTAPTFQGAGTSGCPAAGRSNPEPPTDWLDELDAAGPTTSLLDPRSSGRSKPRPTTVLPFSVTAPPDGPRR